MRAGDVVFIRGKSLVSHVVRWFDPGSFSHVALAVSPTHIVEAEYNTKVRITKIDYPSYKTYEVIDLGLTDKQRDKIVHDAIQMIGARYDYMQILGYVLSPNTRWGSPNSFICSEIVYELLKRNGLEFGDRFAKPNELYKTLSDYCRIKN